MKTSRPASAPLLKPPAQLIADLILQGGLSQAEIARRTGITQPTVSRIQFGKAPCALVNYAALLSLYREHFSAAKALEDSMREEVRAQLLAELSPTPPTPPSNNAAIAEIATE